MRFSCECQRGYKGKDCTEQEFCQLKPCPLGSECKNLEDGYECIANATFDGEMQPKVYSFNSINYFSQINKIEITYRTISWGTVLFAKYLNDYFAVFVENNKVIIEWYLNGFLDRSIFHKENYEGQWLTILLKIKDTVLKGGFKEWINDDTPNFIISDFDNANFTNIFLKGFIYVGGSDENTFNFVKLKGISDNITNHIIGTTENSLSTNSIEYETSTEVFYPMFKVDLNKTSDRFKVSSFLYFFVFIFLFLYNLLGLFGRNKNRKVFITILPQ